MTLNAISWMLAPVVAGVATGVLVWTRRYISQFGVKLALSREKVKTLSWMIFAPTVTILSLLSWSISGVTGPAAFLPLLIAALVVLAWVDAETMLLPDVLTIPLLWAGLLVNLNGLVIPLQDAVIGAVAGYMVPWTVDRTYQIMTGRHGIGMGDMKLLAALGAWLGWWMLPGIFLCAVAVHFVMIAALWVSGRRRRLWKRHLPLGPALATAGIIAAISGWPTLI